MGQSRFELRLAKRVGALTAIHWQSQMFFKAFRISDAAFCNNSTRKSEANLQHRKGLRNAEEERRQGLAKLATLLAHSNTNRSRALRVCLGRTRPTQQNQYMCILRIR
eukprot:3643603-Amphidinium_carterae.1